MSSDRDKYARLTYPPNIKNPSIVECLKLCINDQYGRHVVTTKNLKSGDVIAIEQPFYKSLDMNAIHVRCAKCFKSTMSLIECQYCEMLKFCSKQCENIAWEEFHKFECCYLRKRSQDDAFLIAIERALFKALAVCGGLIQLEQLLDKFPDPVSVFDLDLNKHQATLDKMFLLVCLSLEAAPPTAEEILFAKNFVKNHKVVKSLATSKDQEDFLFRFIIKLIGIFYRNSFTMSWTLDETACGIFLFASMFNHSCSSNVFRICIDDRFYFLTKRPVEANEQLFFCYQ
jgi:SET and MYND domain-containing protein 4